MGRLPILLVPPRNRDIEQVNFIVTRHTLAVGVDQQRCIGDAAIGVAAELAKSGFADELARNLMRLTTALSTAVAEEKS